MRTIVKGKIEVILNVLIQKASLAGKVSELASQESLNMYPPTREPPRVLGGPRAAAARHQPANLP